MFLADTLSRAHFAEVSACEFTLSLAEVDHTMDLPIPQGQLQELKEAAKQDTVLHAISGTIRQGWPTLTSGNCPPLLLCTRQIDGTRWTSVQGLSAGDPLLSEANDGDDT